MNVDLKSRILTLVAETPEDRKVLKQLSEDRSAEYSINNTEGNGGWVILLGNPRRPHRS